MSELDDKKKTKKDKGDSADIPAEIVITTPVATETPAWKVAWDERIAAFAAKVGKTPEQVVLALEPVVGKPGEAALVALADPEAASYDDLKDALNTAFSDAKIPVAILKQNVVLLRGPKPEEKKVETGTPASAATYSPSWDLLPSVPPDGGPLLQALMAGGRLKIDDLTVYSLVRTAFADRQGFFDLPALFKNRLESYMETLEEPLIGAKAQRYIELRNIIVERKYADILGPMGFKGNIMTKANIDKVLNRTNESFWRGLQSFQKQLDPWYKMWLESAGPALMGNLAMAVASSTGALVGGIMPAPMELPDVAPIFVAARSLFDIINKVLASLGVPVVQALAGEATRILQQLDDPDLPVALGYGSKDLMLKEMDIKVSPDLSMMEGVVAHYAISVCGIRNIETWDQKKQYAYLGALYQRGRQINWEVLVNFTKKDGKKYMNSTFADPFAETNA